jgi:hypothetical protein
MTRKEREQSERLADKIEKLLFEQDDRNVTFDALAMVLRNVAEQVKPSTAKRIMDVADDISDLIVE